MIGADFNGHVRAGNRCDKEVMDRFGIQDRNAKTDGGKLVTEDRDGNVLTDATSVMGRWKE